MVNSISQNWYQSFLQNADIHVLKKILVCFRAWSSAPSTFADFCILWSHGYLVWILIVCVWKFKFDLWNKSYRNWTYFHVVLFYKACKIDLVVHLWGIRSGVSQARFKCRTSHEPNRIQWIFFNISHQRNEEVLPRRPGLHFSVSN